MTRPNLCKTKPPRTHISTAKTAQTRPSTENSEALVEQQHEDHDKDATKSDDTNLFGLTFYLTWRSGQWAVSLTKGDPQSDTWGSDQIACFYCPA